MATQEQLNALREQLCPSFCSVSAPSGPCQMKVTLQSAHLPDVSNCLVDGSMPSEVYNRAKQDLHGKFVESYLSGQSENLIIQRRPYPIHPRFSDRVSPIFSTLTSTKLTPPLRLLAHVATQMMTQLRTFSIAQRCPLLLHPLIFGFIL